MPRHALSRHARAVQGPLQQFLSGYRPLVRGTGVFLGMAALGVGLVAGSANPAPAQAPVAATLSASCPAPGGQQVAAATAPSAEVAVYGHGWGHGMGMSQYGAQGAARLGCTYTDILRTYYAGAEVTRVPQRGRVRLDLAAASSKADLAAQGGPVTWLVPRVAHVVQPQGSRWQVLPRTRDGEDGVAVLDESGRVRLFAGAGLSLSAKHSGTVVTLRPWAGTTRLVTRYDTAVFRRAGDRLAVSELIGRTGGTTAVQKYLAGLGEVPTSWPAEALKAQVVAARTYLSTKYSPDQHLYVIKVTTADQVYRGYLQEQQDRSGNWRAAVAATKDEVLLDDAGRTITAMYSSSMGGHTEDRKYVYGRYGIDYLKAVDDSRWDNASDNPRRSWSVGFSRAEFARRLGFSQVTSWSIAERGSSRRVQRGLVVTGTVAGATVTRTFTGAAARTKLGLLSPGFSFEP